MTFPRHGTTTQIPGESRSARSSPVINLSDSPAGRELPSIAWLEPDQVDPGAVVLTCANCGATMDERKCKLICRCGYFLSCSDYY